MAHQKKSNQETLQNQTQPNSLAKIPFSACQKRLNGNAPASCNSCHRFYYKAACSQAEALPCPRRCSFGAGSASLPPPLLGQAMALEDILYGSPCKLPSGTLSAPNYISHARLNNSAVWSKLKAAFQTMYSAL